jgi:hypothetical protein
MLMVVTRLSLCALKRGGPVRSLCALKTPDVVVKIPDPVTTSLSSRDQSRLDSAKSAGPYAGTVGTLAPQI